MKVDKVANLIQTELWPIAKRLEREGKRGTYTLPDRDGSVLADTKAKAIEIINEYIGVNKEQHTRAVMNAVMYTDIHTLLTNVLLKNEGMSTKI